MWFGSNLLAILAALEAVPPVRGQPSRPYWWAFPRPGAPMLLRGRLEEAFEEEGVAQEQIDEDSGLAVEEAWWDGYQWRDGPSKGPLELLEQEGG